MQLVIDVLLIAVFGLLVFCGWWRGFMKSILSLGRLVLSLVITILFGSAFAGWIDETFINPPVFEAVSKKFSSIAAEVTASAEGGIDALVEKIPEAFRGYLDLTTVDPTAEINALVEPHRGRWYLQGHLPHSGLCTALRYLLYPPDRRHLHRKQAGQASGHSVCG